MSKPEKDIHWFDDADALMDILKRRGFRWVIQEAALIDNIVNGQFVTNIDLTQAPKPAP